MWKLSHGSGVRVKWQASLPECGWVWWERLKGAKEGADAPVFCDRILGEMYLIRKGEEPRPVCRVCRRAGSPGSAVPVGKAFVCRRCLAEATANAVEHDAEFGHSDIETELEQLRAMERAAFGGRPRRGLSMELEALMAAAESHGVKMRMR